MPEIYGPMAVGLLTLFQSGRKKLLVGLGSRICKNMVCKLALSLLIITS